MPNNWNAIYLGVQSIIDPTEGNTTAENAGLLAGLTFGAQGSPLSQDVTFVTTDDRRGEVGVLDQNNQQFSGGGNDRITFNIGAGNQTSTFDAAVQYNATLTYDNGSTWTGTLVIMQDTAGRTFLVPPPNVGPEWTALQANPIRSLTLNSVVNATFTGLQQDRPTTSFLTCFAAGSRILTNDGEREIETLIPGDLVQTADDGLQRVRWTGRQTVQGKGNFAPILIRAGALGNHRDLRVSPQHRMLVTGWQAELLFGQDEVLVPACHLVNDHSILRAPAPWITYHHILFDRHQIVVAEGCPSESFYPGPVTMARIEASARRELLALFPGLRRAGRGYGRTARMVIAATEAHALRARLAHAARAH